MRILLVEDDRGSIEAMCEVLLEFPGHLVPSVARTRDEAIDLLTQNFFDLLILDLKIPPDGQSQDARPEYGLAVFAHAKNIAPGMPIFLFTGSSVENFVPSLLANQQQVDIWGTGKLGTVLFLKKIDLDRVSKGLAPYCAGCGSLADVELERAGVSLTLEDERLIRIFARRFNGTRCHVSALSGGLSDSKVVRIKLMSAQGAVLHHAVAKLGQIGRIQDESRRYQQYVVQLPPGATPRLLVSLEFGAKSTAGVFYGVAVGHDVSFFQFATMDAGLIETALTETSRGLAGWYEAAAEGQYRVRDIRRRLVSDEDREIVGEQFPLQWTDDFEDRMVQARWGCVHGDLHGGNILLTAGGMPAVIDYADIAHGASSLDPIALELSLLFHPDAPLHEEVWPSPAQARVWGDLDKYTVSCPYGVFVLQCRAWARRVAAGNREIAASAYSYLIRQLKYPDTNKQLALDLLEGARALFEST